jgi:asparagine synthase (glutamine-hydrolysing)
VFTGEGGDSIFCATSYIFAVDHCLRRYGLGFRTLQTAARVATRRDRTVWSVLGEALTREMFGAGGRQAWRTLEPFCRLVSSEARESTKAGDFRSSAYLSAVKQETLLRLGTLAFAPRFYDLSTSPHDAAPYTASPLCAQPVYELCARIPVDAHFDGGRIRGLARRAFANEVPDPILRRQWKDRPLLQLGEVIQLNLPFIREHLLDGKLVKEGILDRVAVDQALRRGPSSSSAISSEVLSHLDLELWIRDNT